MGYVWKREIEFDEVFTLVAWIGAINILLTLSAKNCSIVHHRDLKTTLRNMDLEEEVYVI